MKSAVFLALGIALFASLSPAFSEEALTGDISKKIFELQQSMQMLQGSVTELRTLVESQNRVIASQAAEIRKLEQGIQLRIPAPSAAAPAPDAGKFGLKKLAPSLQPEIGVAGTVQAHLTENTEDEEGKDTVALKELELILGTYVDPYSRFDGTLAFNDAIEDQNVEIEEAYYSRWGLPLGFMTRLGKFRPEIGKANLVHTHALETADYPLVIQDFFGEHGVSNSGVRLQNMIPNPWDLPLALTGEVLRGDNGNSFSGMSRRPIFNTHLKTSFELREDVAAEFGWTTLFGDENPSNFDPVIDETTGEETTVETSFEQGQDRYGVRVFGADATFQFFLPEGKAAKWQSELYFQNRSPHPHANTNPWGFYSLLDYRFSPRFSTGIRFDYVEPLDVTKEHFATYAVSPYLTFWQSEFANFQIQYQHLEPASADAKVDDAVYLRCNFMAGSHKHPVQ